MCRLLEAVNCLAVLLPCHRVDELVDAFTLVIRTAWMLVIEPEQRKIASTAALISASPETRPLLLSLFA
jgi:hypothetical protein